MASAESVEAPAALCQSTAFGECESAVDGAKLTMVDDAPRAVDSRAGHLFP